MSTYTPSQSSPIPLHASLVPFYENFYAVSDNPSDAAHQEYVDAMTKDGTLVMGSKVAKGESEIMALRKGLWSGPVKTRKHTLHRIYPFAPNGLEVMLYGTVAYVLHNGKDVNVDWAARAVLVEDSSAKQGVRMKEYQVYLDSAVVAAAASS